MHQIEQLNYIKSPVSKVYKALTTEEGLKNVWTSKLKVKPEIGFVNEFDFDEGYLTKMKVVKLNENSRIEWACVESDEEWLGTAVSFTLSEKDGITTVVLRHFKWKERTEYFQWCAYNWAMFLRSLKIYCEKGLEM